MHAWRWGRGGGELGRRAAWEGWSGILTRLRSRESGAGFRASALCGYRERPLPSCCWGTLLVRRTIRTGVGREDLCALCPPIRGVPARSPRDKGDKGDSLDGSDPVLDSPVLGRPVLGGTPGQCRARGDARSSSPGTDSTGKCAAPACPKGWARGGRLGTRLTWPRSHLGAPERQDEVAMRPVDGARGVPSPRWPLSGRWQSGPAGGWQGQPLGPGPGP